MLLRRLLLVTLLATASAPVLAGPLDDSHVGGIGFSGPTTGDLAAIYWNPAALGLMQGGQVLVASTAQRNSESVERASIDPATGTPGGGRSFMPITGTTSHGPLSWPPGPGTFIAVGAAIGNRFSLALATYTPFSQRTQFGAAADASEPTRYHALAIDLRNVALVPALAIRIGHELRLGVAPGFLFSTGRLVFDENTQPGAPDPENPATAARYDVGSGLGVFNSTLSFTVSVGLHWRRKSMEYGVAFISRPLGNEGGGVVVNAGRTSVTPPPLAPISMICGTDKPTDCVFGRLRYDLPDILTGGVTWHASARTTLTGIVRWLTFSRHERLDIRLVGPASGTLGTDSVPERVVLYRGFRDVIEGRVRIERILASWLRIGAALRADSGAVPPGHLSPGAIGSPALEPALMADLRLRNWVSLGLGYAFTFMPTVDSGGSVFDPTAASRCEAAAGDLLAPDCRTRMAGAARPTAAGTYGATEHTASLAATFRF